MDPAAEPIHRWGTCEVTLRAHVRHADPYHDVTVDVRFVAPSGGVSTVRAFWDGSGTWRFRFSPDELGRWSWETSCSDPGDPGLHGVAGALDCVEYEGDNPLYAHGPVAPLHGARHFVHADGKPFFWLGDTAWNGPMRSNEADWDGYLAIRRSQGFSAIQFFSTTWRGLDATPEGMSAFLPDAGPSGARRTPDPAFYRRLDARVRAINAHGLLAAPILVLALYDEDEGWALSEDELVRLCGYVMARWGAYHVAWTLGGDGDFRGSRSERWKRVGRSLEPLRRKQPMTMHPCGLVWVADEFRDEPWFDFIVYQSCHFGAPEKVAWLPTGPVGGEWHKNPPRPILNVEPNYEEHPAVEDGVPFTDFHVRRAACWSLLLVPPCGVTYGNFHVWSWSDVPEDGARVLRGLTANWPPLGPWRDHLATPGVSSMTNVRRFFERGPWWTLRPDDGVLLEQPGDHDPLVFAPAASTGDRSWTVLYTPRGGTLRLRAESLPTGAVASWFDPRSGEWAPAELTGHPGGEVRASTPDERDWLLDLRTADGVSRRSL